MNRSTNITATRAVDTMVVVVVRPVMGDTTVC